MLFKLKSLNTPKPWPLTSVNKAHAWFSWLNVTYI